MNNLILFPFEHHHDNRSLFNRVMELARRLEGEVILYTALPWNARPEELDAVYLHLLDLYGHYQTHHLGWRALMDVPMRRIIHRGDFRSGLYGILQREPIDVLVCSPQVPQLPPERLSSFLSRCFPGSVQLITFPGMNHFSRQTDFAESF